MADTKLDLVLDPGGFLSRSLQAWDPQAAFGQLQNQAYGYLWPMGSFFLVGDGAGLPGWLVQRLWWCLVLLVAYTGVLRLAALLRIGTPNTRILAALLFALSPRLLSTLATISVESWPTALLPWILVPLVVGSQRGSPRRAAALSALAVACLGGVNAAASLAVLVVPVLYLATRRRGPRRRALAVWWAAGVGLAVAWWLVPLLVLGRSAYPFLDYIESARATTSAVSAFNVLRGTDHWLGFVVGDSGPAWTTAFWLSTDGLAVLATAAIALLGLLGLLRRTTPERWFLVLTVATGAGVIGIGYLGASGSPVADLVRPLLDGPLAPLRNVHKFDALVRLPVSLGAAAAAAALPGLLRPAADRLLEPPYRHRGPQVAATLAVMILLVPLAVVWSRPASGALPNPGSFPSVPTAWDRTARWLADSSPSGRALLVPASNFGEYAWGRPMDEPLQSLAESPWAVRNAVPLGAPGATRWLDGIQAVLAEGRPAASLAGALRSAGVTHLVLRNDLSPFTAVLPAAVARATLMGSPGLERVARFGDLVFTGAGARRAIEVFAVDGVPAASTTLGAGGVTEVIGGPEALATHDLSAPGAVVLRPDLPADGSVPVARTIETDTLRRRAVNFGAQRAQDATPTLRADEDPRRGRRVGDVSPFPAGTDETTLAYIGVDDVRASSSTADPFVPGYAGPWTRPFSAIDGDRTTAWVSNPANPDPWWQVAFTPREVGDVVVRLPRDTRYERAGAVRVTTDAGSVVAPVAAETDDDVARVRLPAGVTDELRVEPVGGAARSWAVAEVEIPGLAAAETLVMQAAPPGAELRVRRAPGARRSCLLADPGAWWCSPGLAAPGEEVVSLDRTVTVAGATALTGATVRLRPGRALDAALDGARGLSASASSRLVTDPAARPGAAFDGDPATGWVSAPGDEAPRLTVAFAAPVTASRLVAVADAATRARVSGVTVSTESGTVRVPLGRRTAIPLGRPLTGKRWTFTFALTTTDPTMPAASIRLMEVGVGGRNVTAATRMSVPCGRGPGVIVDGRRVDLAVETTTTELLRDSVVPARPCSPVTAGGGTVRMVSADSDVWRVEGLDWAPAGLEEPAVTASSPAPADRWEPESRRWTLAAADARILALTEGFNSGWQARSGAAGESLQPLRLDGWRQAWVVPAGAGGAVTADFAPGTWHRAGLLAGLLALLLLVPMLLVPSRRPAPAPAVPVVPPTWAGPLAAVVVGLALAGPAGAAIGLAAAWLVARAPRAPGVVIALALAVGAATAVATGRTWGDGPTAAVAQLSGVSALAVLLAAATARSHPGAGADPLEDGTLDGPP